MQPNASPDLLVDGSPAANRTSMVLVLVAAVAIFGNCLLNSPRGFSDKHREDTSLLKPVVTALALGGAFPTTRGVEIRNLVFYCGAAVLALVAAIRLASTDRRPRISGDDLLDIRRRASSPYFWWLLLLIASVLSSMFSHAPDVCKGQSIIRFLHLAWWWPLAALLAPQHVRKLVTALLIVLGLTAGVGIWYYAKRNIPGTRLQYPIGNELWLAACLLPGVFLAIGLFAERILRTLSRNRQDNASAPSGSDLHPSQDASECGTAVSAVSSNSCGTGVSPVSSPPRRRCHNHLERNSQSSAWPRLLLLLAAGGVILVALALTYSRSAGVGLAAGAFAVICFVSTKTARRLTLLAALILAFIGAMYVQSLRSGGVMGQRAHSIRARLNYEWPYAMMLFLKKPILGHGDGSYALLAGQYAREDQLEDPGTISFDELSWIGRTHNEFLQLLADLGLVGAFAFGAALVLTLYRALQYCDRARGDPTAAQRRWLVVGLTGALIALIFEECGSPAIHEPGLPPVFLTVWAALWALVRGQQPASVPAADDKVLGNFALRLGGVAAGICAVLLGYFAIQDWRGSRAQYETRADMMQGRYAQAVTHADFANRHTLDSFQQLLGHLYAVWGRSLQFNEMLKASDDPPTDRDLAVAQQALAQLNQLTVTAPRFLKSARLRADLSRNLALASRRRGESENERGHRKNWTAALERHQSDEPFRMDIVEELWIVKPDAPTKNRLHWLRCLLRNGGIDPDFLQLFRQLDESDDFVAAMNDLFNVAMQDLARPPYQWADRLSPETFRVAALAKALTGQPDEAARLAGEAEQMYAKAGPRLFAAHASALHEIVTYGFDVDPKAHTNESLEQLARAHTILWSPVDAAAPLPDPLGQMRLLLLLAAGREKEAEAQLNVLDLDDMPLQQRLAHAYLHLAARFSNRPAHLDQALGWTRRAVQLSPDLPRAYGLLIRLLLHKGDDEKALDAARRFLDLAQDQQATNEYLDNLQARYPGSPIWAELGRQPPEPAPTPSSVAPPSRRWTHGRDAHATDDARATDTEVKGRVLKVVTYNVHRCRGGLDRIIELLREQEADIIFLQEVGRAEAGDQDQAVRIAEALGGMQVISASMLGLPAAQYCDVAILSWFELDAGKAHSVEEGGRVFAIQAKVETSDQKLHLLSVHTHSTFRLKTSHVINSFQRRLAEVSRLLDVVRGLDGDLLVAGDFNATPWMPEYHGITSLLTDYGSQGAESKLTFPSHKPAVPIDYIFGRGEFAASAFQVLDSMLSDHRPVVVELKWMPANTDTVQPASQAKDRSE